VVLREVGVFVGAGEKKSPIKKRTKSLFKGTGTCCQKKKKMEKDFSVIKNPTMNQAPQKKGTGCVKGEVPMHTESFEVFAGTITPASHSVTEKKGEKRSFGKFAEIATKRSSTWGSKYYKRNIQLRVLGWCLGGIESPDIFVESDGASARLKRVFETGRECW